MAQIEFYDLKLKKKVKVDDKKVVKVTFNTSKGGIRYGLKATTDDGRTLTKFVGKADWDKMKLKEE